MTLEKLTDEDLFARFQAGEQVAFDVLHQRYNTTLVRRLAWRLRGIRGGVNDAADAASRTWYEVAKTTPDKFTPEVFAPWLFWHAERMAIRAMRSWTRFSRDTQLSVEAVKGLGSNRQFDHRAAFESRSQAILERLSEKETFAKLAALIEDLPRTQRALISRVYFEGLDYREAGQQVGLSKNAVYQQLQTAIDRLGRAIYWDRLGKPDQLPEFPRGSAAAAVFLQVSNARCVESQRKRRAAA